MMLFGKPPAEDNDDALIDLVVSRGVAEGIRRALARDDLTPEDRQQFEDALERLREQ